MKKLLYVTTRLFWSQNSGHEVLLFNYCKYLHQALGYEIHILSFLGPGQKLDEGDIPDYIASVELLVRPTFARVISNVLFNGIRRDYPLQAALFCDPTNDRKIEKKVACLQPDAVIVDMIRLAPFISALSKSKSLKVLGLDDLLSKRYEVQLLTRGTGDLFGSYAGSGQHLARRLVGIRAMRDAVLKLESRRTRRAERASANSYDGVLLVSESEAEELNAATGLANARATGMGVDVDYFSADIEVDSMPNTVSFLGNFNYGPNADSLRLIVNEILPNIKTSVTLRVVGQCPASIRAEFASKSNIEFLARDEDQRYAIRATEIFVAPIAYGSGVKTKIVEAMAMGMCVVTNSVGAQSLAVENATELMIVDDPIQIAECVDHLLHSPSDRMRLGLAASAFADTHCRWEKSLSCFREMGF